MIIFFFGGVDVSNGDDTGEAYLSDVNDNNNKACLTCNNDNGKFVVIFGLLLISDTIKSCFVGVL